MSLPKLTEAIIRAGATTQSMARGREYFDEGALYDMGIQGNVLTGLCTGQSAPMYRVRVVLDEAGIADADCTCAYEWDGWCKHIVALLLAWVHEPQRFVERASPAELLAGLERDELRDLWLRLVADQPEMVDWLAAALAAPRAAGPGPRRPADPGVYRRQVAAILRSAEGRYGYVPYGAAGDLVRQLGEMEGTAQRFLDAGDPATALEVLLAILEGAGGAIEAVDDEGDLAGYLMDLGLPLAEAILSLEPGEEERSALRRRLQKAGRQLADYCAEEGGDLALQALQQGWSGLGDDELTEAKLNVLERQGRTDEYLGLCRQSGNRLRYVLKLCDLGRVDEAATYARAYLSDADDALDVAKRLRELGRVDDAVAVAERGLALAEPRFTLAEWLAPLEETLGRTAQALEAWFVVLAEDPSLAAYQAVKRLAGPAWPTLQPRAMTCLEDAWEKGALAEVLLYEQQWDAAIALAERERSNWGLKETIAAGVAHERPAWVAHTAIAEAERLLVDAKTSHYPPAVEWLQRAQAAYIRMGRSAEFEAYLAELKARYRRRSALLRELHGL